MHIPPLYKRASWQRFLAGTAIGAIIAYMIFLFIFGELQENWIQENMALRAEYQDLNKSYETLLENHRALDQQSKEGIEIKEIDIAFTNLKELKLENDRIMVHQIEEAIREEANYAMGKSVEEIATSIDLLISTIENKTINIDDFSYQSKISRIIVMEQLQLSIELSVAD
ncbi:sporulation membrane protein YtrI [Gracilibacillus dipsosauri]|uniref:Sporulation membrane protein YtrI C-terminal domain-containing protein n=2 Tax=Gracilibacillus TaxID=74385 RepID=A0A317L041_9BACI|nr:sporulation membrane protein YtrI [Gracilibacillus dipsosauri]PWU69171.1 hypothetical protein DLJ74_06665 [Gracilibacillus dipsosauri]